MPFPLHKVPEGPTLHTSFFQECVTNNLKNFASKWEKMFMYPTARTTGRQHREPSQQTKCKARDHNLRFQWFNSRNLSGKEFPDRHLSKTPVRKICFLRLSLLRYVKLQNLPMPFHTAYRLKYSWWKRFYFTGKQRMKFFGAAEYSFKNAIQTTCPMQVPALLLINTCAGPTFISKSMKLASGNIDCSVFSFDFARSEKSTPYDIERSCYCTNTSEIWRCAHGVASLIN